MGGVRGAYLSYRVKPLNPAPLWRPQCPGGAFTPDIQTTKEFPDDVVTFARNHPVMFNPIYPVGRRPLVVRTNADYRYTAVAVDQVAASDGNYQVLFLGTGESPRRRKRVLARGLSGGRREGRNDRALKVNESDKRSSAFAVGIRTPGGGGSGGSGSGGGLPPASVRQDR